MRHKILVLLFATGCGATTVSPDETTVEGHQREAESERNAARAELARHRMAAEAPGGNPDLVNRGAYSSGGVWQYPPQSYDPHRYHIDVAEAHSEHARAHEAAAAELARFEEAECKGFPPETRAACPILGPAVGYREVPHGIAVIFQEGVPVAAVAAHMRCHLAFARAHGYQPDCPLYLKGVAIAVTADGRGVSIQISDDDQVGELRRRARQQMVVVGPSQIL